MSEIHFFSEKVRFKPRNQKKLRTWLIKVAKVHGRPVESLNYVFCSDGYLFEINKSYLGHKTLTDIISFEFENPEGVEGEIYISVPRVRENAANYKVGFDHELRRVLVHGLLHLLGFKDKSAPQKARMRAEEEASLSLWK